MKWQEWWIPQKGINPNKLGEYFSKYFSHAQS